MEVNNHNFDNLLYLNSDLTFSESIKFKSMSEQCKNFIRSLVTVNPNKRPSAEKVNSLLML